MNSPSTGKNRLRRRILLGGIAVVIVLAVVAVYLFYAPKGALPPGPVEVATLDIDKDLRRYTVFVPENLKPGGSVLFAFHSSQSKGEEMRRIVGGVLEPLAEKDHFLIVYPDGFEGHFNDARRMASYSARKRNIDDVGLTRAIIEKLQIEKQINPKNVYAIGYSNGGHMALRLGLEAPDLVKGVAAIAANLPAPDNLDCNLAPTPSRYIVFVEGTRDPINPCEGGKVSLFGFANRGPVLSAQASAQWFAEKLGLFERESPPPAQGTDLSVSQQDWQSPTGHVRLITILGGGHTVPQAAYRFPRIFGATLPSDDVLESIWELFAATRSSS